MATPCDDRPAPVTFERLQEAGYLAFVQQHPDVLSMAWMLYETVVGYEREMLKPEVLRAPINLDVDGMCEGVGQCIVRAVRKAAVGDLYYNTVIKPETSVKTLQNP